MAYIKYWVESSSDFADAAQAITEARQRLKDEYDNRLRAVGKTINNNIFYTINNNLQNFKYSNDEIASIVNKRVKSTGAYNQIAHLFEIMNEEANDVQSWMNQHGNDPVFQDLQQLANGFVPDGKYSVKGEKSLQNLSNYAFKSKLLKKDLYNRIGDLGESISEVAGAAVTGYVLDKLASDLGGIENVTIQKENLGTQIQNSYHYQTDNKFSVDFTVSASGAQGHFELNFSDKAGLNIMRSNVTLKKTNSAYWKRSSVKKLSGDLNPSDYYNIISWHRLNSTRELVRVPQEHYQALTSYYGYKLLLEMFLESRMHDDEINFTIYGGHIIPEVNVYEHFIKDRGVILETLRAQIARSGLTRVNSRGQRYAIVKNEEQAQGVIDNMNVSLRAVIPF